MSFFKNAGKWIVRNIPTILSGVTGAGIAVTSFLSAKAALKASEKIEELESDGHEITQSEFITEIAPIYIPTGISLVLTEVCNFANWKVNKDRYDDLKARYAALMCGYVGISEIFNKYRVKVKEVAPELDEETMNEIKEEIREEMRLEWLEELDDGKRTYNIEFFPNLVECTPAQLSDAFNEFNERLNENKKISLDEFCDILDAEKWKNNKGKYIGWSAEDIMLYKGYPMVHFTVEVYPDIQDDGMEVFNVYVDIEPEYCFEIPIHDRELYFDWVRKRLGKNL